MCQNLKYLRDKFMSIFSRSSQVEETNRRKRLKMTFLTMCVLVMFLNLIIWFWVSQPVLPLTSSNVQLTDAERLRVHVQTLSETFFPRNAPNIENLNKVASYIKEEFKKANGNVLEQPYKIDDKMYKNIVDKTYKNIIAEFGPESDERIIIGAHYDAAGELPGADDNASGVAAIIELAYLLGKAKLPMKVELVAFTLEEPPFFDTEFMGSAIHAKSLKEKDIKVRLMISVEMVGYFSDLPNSQEFPLSLLNLIYPTTGNFIILVGNLENGLTLRKVKKAMQKVTSLPVYSINAPRSIPGIDFSDHLNYWNLGYNALMVSDTAFYRNKNYHTKRDTAEKLDYRRMAMVVDGLYNIVLETSK